MTTWWSLHQNSNVQELRYFVGSCYWMEKPQPFLLIVRELEQGWQTCLFRNEFLSLESMERVVEKLCNLKEPNNLSIEYITSELSVEPEANVEVPKSQALQLETVEIPKPWGAEIWHTGVENRGVCSIRVGNSKLELPFWELIQGQALDKEASSVILLKELVPFAIPFYGELYTELHEEKSEVYIVSGVDECLYPDQLGKVKLGLKDYKKASLQLYQESLKSFEATRDKIDSGLQALGHSFPKSQTEAEVKEIAAKKSKLSDQLLQKEAEQYQRISDFTEIHSIGLGDIVRVPTHTPHALQPGVRVVEFQTPVYERKVLASNQKLLTQSSCDIDQGIPLIKNTVTQDAILRSGACNSQFQRIEVVSFKEFSIWQVNIAVPFDELSKMDQKEYLGAMAKAEIAFILTGVLEGNQGKRLRLDEGHSYLLQGQMEYVPTRASKVLFGAKN